MRNCAENVKMQHGGRNGHVSCLLTKKAHGFTIGLNVPEAYP